MHVYSVEYDQQQGCSRAFHYDFELDMPTVFT